MPYGYYSLLIEYIIIIICHLNQCERVLTVQYCLSLCDCIVVVSVAVVCVCLVGKERR